MSCKALFLYIMSMCVDENIINLSASYNENILNCCKSELIKLSYHTSSVEVRYIAKQFFFYANIKYHLTVY